MTGRSPPPATEPAEPIERQPSGAALSQPAGAVGDSLVVAGWTLVSRLTGFGRVAAIAAVLGPTYFGNTYQATNSLPNTVYYGLLAGSLVSSILVPALVRHIDLGDREACERVVGGALGLVLAALAVVAPLVLLAAPLLLGWGSLGSGQAGVAAAQQQLAQVFLVMLLPQVFLYAVVGCSSAVMNAQRRFALAAAAPALENLGCIAVLGLTAILYGDASSIEAVPRGEVLLLGLGTTAAVALHAATQWYGAWRTGVRLRPRAGWRDAELVTVLRRTVPSLMQAALGALQVLAVLFVCNRVAGGVVAFQVAATFYFLPIALGATPVALSLLPRLSRLHQAGDEGLFRDTVVRGLRFAFFITVPAAVTVALLAPALARAVSFGRMAEQGGDVLVASTLLVLAAGIVGETGFLIGTYASYARGDTRSPLRSMLVKFGACFAVLAVALGAHGSAVVVLASAAVSVAALAGAAHRIAGLLSGAPVGVERLGPAVLRSVLSAAVMVPPLWVGRALLSGVDSQVGALAGVAAVTLPAAAAYVAVQAAFRAPEAGWLVAALLPGRRSRPGVEAALAGRSR
jgi:putative peptidoglycan lipid II flippase